MYGGGGARAPACPHLPSAPCWTVWKSQSNLVFERVEVSFHTQVRQHIHVGQILKRRSSILTELTP